VPSAAECSSLTTVLTAGHLPSTVLIRLALDRSSSAEAASVRFEAIFASPVR
jgi:hypothetical protein